MQTGHFIEEVRHKHTVDTDITFYGQEKADLNSKLARMNLAVHGLEGQIRIGNTFYDDHQPTTQARRYAVRGPRRLLRENSGSSRPDSLQPLCCYGGPA